MVNIKDRLELISVISEALGLISLVIPFDPTSSIEWYWRINRSPSINISTALILMGSILLISVGVYSKKTEKHDLDILECVGGILLLGVPIIFQIERGSSHVIYQIPYWTPVIGGILGLIAGIIGVKNNSSGIMQNRIGKFGIFLTGCGFLGFLVNFFIPTPSSWAYYYIVGPSMIVIGLVVLVIGIIKSSSE